MSIKKNILKNSIPNIVVRLITVGEQLLLVPFFIASWGTAYYGEWLTLTIIPAVLTFSNLGVGTAAANSFVLKYAAGKKSEAANTARTGLVAISVVIFGGILLGIVGLVTILKLDLFKNSLINTADAIYALSFMMTGCLLEFYYQLFSAYFRAARKADLGMNLLALRKIFNIIAGCSVLFAGYGVVAFAFSQLIVSIVFFVLYRWVSIAILKLNREYSGHFIKSEAKEIFSKGLGYLMYPIWQILFFQGTTFIVRLTLGPASVTVFNTLRTLSRSVNQIFEIVNRSVFPELQYEIGQGQIDKARKIFVYAVRSVLVFSVFGIAFLAVFGLPLYDIWTHNELNPPVMMWNTFLAGIFFNAVWGTSSFVFEAVNKPYRFAVTAVICVTISIICSYIFCLQWGLVGVAIGGLIFDVLMSLYVLPVSCKLIGQPLCGIFGFVR